MVCPFADTLTVVIAMTGLSRKRKDKKKDGGRGHEGAKYPEIGFLFIFDTKLYVPIGIGKSSLNSFW